jgi:hypothetical protein
VRGSYMQLPAGDTVSQGLTSLLLSVSTMMAISAGSKPYAVSNISLMDMTSLTQPLRACLEPGNRVHCSDRLRQVLTGDVPAMHHVTLYEDDRTWVVAPHQQSALCHGGQLVFL